MAAAIGCAQPAMAQEENIGGRLSEDIGFIFQDATILLETTGWAFMSEPNGLSDRVEASGSLRFEFIGPVLDSWEIALIPELHLASEPYIVEETARVGERGEQRPMIGVAEAWVSRQMGPVNVKAGKQIFAWGAGDIFSPSDDLNAQDKLNLPWAEKLGELALSVSWAEPEFGLQAVMIPFFTPDRQPLQGNAWARDRSAIADAFQAMFGMRPQLIDGARDIPEGEEDIQYGFRATSSALLDGWDLSASVFRGVMRAPILGTRLVAPQVLALDSRYPHYVEAAAGFSTIVEEFEVHGEAAWHVTDKADEGDDYLSYVIGFRKEWSDFDFDDISKLQLTLEYAGETVTRRVESESAFIQNSFDRAFDNSLLAEFEIEVDDDTKITTAGALNFDERDWAIDSSVEHALDDRIAFTLGVQFYDGPRDSFFGEWRRNDRVYLTLSWYL